MERKSLPPLAAGLLLVLVSGAPLWGQESPKSRNRLYFDLGTQQGVDDNPDGSNQASRFFELTPHLRFEQDRKHGFWAVDYQSTLRRYSGFSSQDRFDHQFGFDSGYRFSYRWSVDFHSTFLRSSNPFLRVADNNVGETTPGDVLFGPNRGFVGPERRSTSLSSALTFHYMLGPHSRLNFGTDYFRRTEQVTPLLNQDTRNVRVEYEKQYARNKALAALYSLQLFRTPAADTRVRTHSILFTHSYELRPGTRLVLFGGPQFSLVRAEPTVELNLFFFTISLDLQVREPVNTFAWGALLTQRLNDQTWLDLSVSRRVSEGGGFTGTVIQKSARLGLGRQLTRRLSVSLAGYLTDNRSLGGVELTSNLRTLGFSTGVSYALGRRVDLQAQYDFTRLGSAPEQLEPLRSRNRFTVGIHYSFGTVPLGG
ncbi:MAG: hypothetical protein ACE5JX_01175 [Acidobacteriota bacterium]